MKFGNEKIFNHTFEDRNDIVMWDVLEVTNEQFLRIKIIGTNSKNRQGFRLAIDVGDGNLEVNNITAKEMYFWADTAPDEFICKCKSSEGLLSIYNIWDKGKGRQSQMHTSGMLIEQEGNVFTYSCNDYGFETNFDKLIFSIEMVEDK